MNKIEHASQLHACPHEECAEPDRCSKVGACVDSWGYVNLPAAAQPIVTDDMVGRFLGWKLPDDFAPDCGVMFDSNIPDSYNGWPTGTNLLTANQTRAMLEYVLQTSPVAAQSAEPVRVPTLSEMSKLWDEAHKPFGSAPFRLSHIEYSRALLASYGQPTQPAAPEWPKDWINQLNFEYKRGLEDGRAQAAPPADGQAQQECRSPYCECEPGQCRNGYADKMDARPAAWTLRRNEAEDLGEDEGGGEAWDVMLPNREWKTCVAVDAEDALKHVRGGWHADHEPISAQPDPAMEGVSVASVNPQITLTLRQAMELLEFFGGHDAEVSIGECPFDPPGLYAWCTEYPEEGSHYLGPTEVDDDLATNGIQPVSGEDARDAARYRWLRDHACNSLHLTRNGDHACNYVTAKEWIEKFAPADDFADDDPAEVKLMKETNTIWRLQAYPDTPVGFNVWNGATLDSVIDAAMKQRVKR